MKALLKGPDNDGFREIVIPNDLGTLQAIVGGHIETLTIAEDAVVICNEGGKLLGLPDNCIFLGMWFVGAILIVGVDGDEFTDCPWSVEMANGGIER